MENWKEGNVAPSRHEIDVAAAPTGLKLVAVSGRLRRSLVHPNKTARLTGIRYSPDGKRIVAGDYPGGIVQVWDSATGAQLMKVETGAGPRASDNDCPVSPDWKTLYVPRSKWGGEQVVKDGKKVIRWHADGDVRAWDLDTGKLVHTFQHDPPRAVSGMALSPDGSAFATFEFRAGESDRFSLKASSLWDVKAKTYRALYPHLNYWSVFTPDGRTLVAPAMDASRETNSIKLVDVASAKERSAISLGDKDATLGFLALSPDAKLLVAQVRVKSRHWLKFWDLATLRPVGSFEGEPNDHVIWMTFSPDGRTLAFLNSAERAPRRLCLFDVATTRLRKTLVLAENGSASAPVFSPDGKWLAVATRTLPDEFPASHDPGAEELPQPRIHLVDVATGERRESIVSPQA